MKKILNIIVILSVLLVTNPINAQESSWVGLIYNNGEEYIPANTDLNGDCFYLVVGPPNGTVESDYTFAFQFDSSFDLSGLTEDEVTFGIGLDLTSGFNCNFGITSSVNFEKSSNTGNYPAVPDGSPDGGASRTDDVAVNWDEVNSVLLVKMNADITYTNAGVLGLIFNTQVGNSILTPVSPGAYPILGKAFAAGFSYDTSLYDVQTIQPFSTPVANNIYIGGTNQVDISAVVDPTISLTLSSNTCNLGNLTTATANTCTYDVTTATNAANGLVVKFSADTAYLASGSNNIDACASSGCTGGVNAGTEEYGFYVSTVGSNHSATGYNADSEPLPTTATTVITAADPHTDTTSTITHKAAVSPITPAGAYFHTVTVTAVGSF